MSSDAEQSGPEAWDLPEIDVLIRESHLDTFGHVNNATYLSLFEQARWDLIEAGGYGLRVIRQTGLGPVVLEAKIGRAPV
jgi:acyl-CoA thioester hydrolase